MLKAPLDAIQALAHAVKPDAQTCTVFVSVSNVAPQAGHAKFQLTNPADHRIKLALNPFLTGLTTLQVFKKEVFNVLSHGASLAPPCPPNCGSMKPAASARAGDFGDVGFEILEGLLHCSCCGA